jgi:hypothetical protein
MHSQAPKAMGQHTASDPSADGFDFDREWFLQGDRTSSPPPSSTRTPKPPATLPAPPLGDPFADEWFR